MYLCGTGTDLFLWMRLDLADIKANFKAIGTKIV